MQGLFRADRGALTRLEGDFCVLLRRGDVKHACPLVSATAGRTKVTNRQTKHFHITCSVITASPASIHSRPSRMAKLSPLRPPVSLYQHSISPKAAAAVFPSVSPPHLLLLFLAVDIFLSIHSALSSLPLLSPSSSLFLPQTPPCSYTCPARLRSHSQTHSSTSVWSRWHLQISM